MPKLHLKGFFINTSDKEGRVYRDKKGRKFSRVVLSTSEGQYSKLFYEDEEDLIPKWKAGDSVDVNLSENKGFKNWDFADYKTKEDAPSSYPQEDPTQERIIRGMIYNNVSRRAPDTDSAEDILSQCKVEYDIMKDWLTS